MTLLPDVLPWLLVLDLVTAAIAMLPYRKTTAVRAEYLDSLNQTTHPRGHQARHPAKLPLPTSANEQQHHHCGESPDELDERLAGTPLAHAPDAVPAMSRDTAENTGQPAQSLLTATSRNDDPDLLQDMVDNTADCGRRWSTHSAPYRAVATTKDLELVDPYTYRHHLTASPCTGTAPPFATATRRSGEGCGP